MTPRNDPDYRQIAGMVICSLLLSACASPGYYFQAASGQWKLLHARQDVAELLDSPSTSPQLSTQLETAREAIAFAETTLDLSAGNSYSSYVDIEADALVWNVIATDEFSLQAKNWCFLIAGCVPYRGYFKQAKADVLASKLLKKGMDVAVMPAAAYSTLGWFDDPLISTMFTGSDAQLAAYLFHELAHQRLYVKGDSRFNEGYASFVEDTGVQSWLKTGQKPAELEAWERLLSALQDFNTLIGELRAELTSLYASEKSITIKRQQKTVIFTNFSNAYDAMSIDKWQGRNYFSNWFEVPLNNARLALYSTYEDSRCAFKSLLEQAKNDISEFHFLAEQKAKLKKAARNRWLNQNCKNNVLASDV